MRLFVSFFLALLSFSVEAQVGVNTTSPNASSLLDVTSTSKGFAYPRLTNTQISGISSPATGLIVYNTDATALYIYNGSAWNSLEDRISGFIDDGVSLQLDQLKVQLSTNTSERSLQISTTTGSINISGSGYNVYPSTSMATGGVAGTLTSYVRQTDAFSTSYTTFQPGLHFTLHGSVQTIQLMDETNNLAYQIILIVGSSYKNNFISLKRIK
jgi:hypothetical protein